MSREKGDKLEDFVSKRLDINKTTNSGAKFNNADLADKYFLIECKYKDIDRFKPEWKELKKVMKQAGDSGRDWIYIQENQEGKFVTVGWDLFEEMWLRYHERNP